MPIYYNKSHSITFMKGNMTKNSWTDFHMVPSSRPYVVPPPPRLTFVNLPRSNTILDLTTALTNGVTFDVSEGEWEFYIDHDLWNGWPDSFDTISDFFDGASFTVKLDDQEEHVYYGQIYVSNYVPGEDYSRITLHYIFDVNLYDGSVGPTPGPDYGRWIEDISTIVNLTEPIHTDSGASRLIGQELQVNYNANATKYVITLTYEVSQDVPIGAQTFYLIKKIGDTYLDEITLINEHQISNDKIVASVNASYFSNTNGKFYLAGRGNFRNIRCTVGHYQKSGPNPPGPGTLVTDYLGNVTFHDHNYVDGVSRYLTQEIPFAFVINRDYVITLEGESIAAKTTSGKRQEHKIYFTEFVRDTAYLSDDYTGTLIINTSSSDDVYTGIASTDHVFKKNKYYLSIGGLRGQTSIDASIKIEHYE